MITEKDGEFITEVDFYDGTNQIKVNYTAYPQEDDFVFPSDHYYSAPGHRAYADFEVEGISRHLTSEEWLECTEEDGKYYKELELECLDRAFWQDEIEYDDEF